jgi:riboflavin biosynthesis pyrimidine reductase
LTVRCIFVVDSEGRWADEQGASRGISNAADFEFLKESRRWADLILTSGKTVRANKYSPTLTAMWIISRGSDPAYSALLSSGAKLIRSDAVSAIQDAKSQFNNVLVEFGPSSIKQALAGNLVDEFDLSVTGANELQNPTQVISKLPFALELNKIDLIKKADDLTVYRLHLAN